MAQIAQLGAAVERALHAYLSAAGVHTEATRLRWISRVEEGLERRRADIATEDIAEEALEVAQRILEEQLFFVGGADSINNLSLIACTQLSLLAGNDSGLLDRWLEQTGNNVRPYEHKVATRASAIQPLRATPTPALLSMPVQTIELRSLNPFKLLARLLR